MRQLTLLFLIVTASALGGCGGRGSDKAGGDAAKKVTTLRFVNGAGDYAELRPFAEEVSRRSGGTLRVRVSAQAHPGDPAFEAPLIRDVVAGRADFGWAGTRAFDDFGVHAFDALHAPLLIDSYTVQRDVLKSSLPGEML